MNVARTLGGTLTVNNRNEGGAEVVIALPLSAMILQESKEQ
jgi:two-component system sensor histidine kinase RegB